MTLSRPCFVFDLETAPTTEALQLRPDEDYLNRGIREDFKPETVAKYQQRNASEWPREIEKRASLDWRLGQIVAGGTAQLSPEHEGVLVRLAISVGDPEYYIGPAALQTRLAEALEREGVRGVHISPAVCRGEEVLLEALWNLLRLDSNMPLSLCGGFNIRNFDLPWLLGRSAARGVPPTRRFNPSRYSNSDVVDWAELLAWQGAFPTKGWALEQYAEWFKLPHRPWGSGAEVPRLWFEGDLTSVATHLMFDLLTTLDLHLRFAPAYLAEIAS